jgi:hypothetical protein
LQVPTDFAYRLLPWREMAPQPVAPGNELLSDVLVQTIPFRALVRDRLLRLEPPLWASETGTGQPLPGNAQSAPFSPLGLMALPLPAVRALPVMAALRLFPPCRPRCCAGRVSCSDPQGCVHPFSLTLRGRGSRAVREGHVRGIGRPHGVLHADAQLLPGRQRMPSLSSTAQNLQEPLAPSQAKDSAWALALTSIWRAAGHDSRRRTSIPPKASFPPPRSPEGRD